MDSVCFFRQSSKALRMASGARLLQTILYSGIPPSASATLCLLIFSASSTGLPITISVAIDEQAIATAQPVHLKRTSVITSFSMRMVMSTVSLSTGLRRMASAEGFVIRPELRGLA